MDMSDFAVKTLLPFAVAVAVVVGCLLGLASSFSITTLALYLAPGVSILALIYGAYQARIVLSYDAGTPQMQKIAGAIREGSDAYLKRQFRSVAPITVALAIILGYALGIGTALTFLLGAILSGLSGYFGMYMAVRGNVRTTSASRKGLAAALDVAFGAGAVNGMLLVGLSLLGISAIYVANYFLYMPYGEARVTAEALKVLIGFGFGANLIALFMRVGGGIYTKGADVGADLVGKVESGLPEDDPRNPAVIADNVGDNVGDCAGMGADIFESYSVTIVAAMLLGGILFGIAGAAFPLVASAAGILASMIGTFFTKLQKGEQDPMAPLNRGLWLSALAAVVLWYFIV
ncbi:MAG: sodium/proton-translocating pyrophosphatase, partial [Candidatus Micrarchaeia archaeon]